MKIKGRIFNGIEWKNQEILIQTGATANHIKGILIDGIPIYEGEYYIYKTFEGNNFSCKKYGRFTDTTRYNKNKSFMLYHQSRK